MFLITDQQQLSLAGKAGNLAQLQALGLPVPRFSTLAFDFMQGPAYRQAAQSWQKAWLDFDGSLVNAESCSLTWIAEFLSQEDLTVLANFDPQQAYSVRSSANIEDGQQHSFAGQFISLLNVQGKDLPAAVKQVLHSFYQPEVLAYLHYNKLHLQDLTAYIIIQEMVQADYSGIYFTANPRGLLNEHLMVVGPGLGNQVVEDRVDVKTYSIHPQDDLILASNQPEEIELARQTIKNLQTMAITIQDHYQQAMDIEFALKDDDIFILQARPITQLNQQHQYILDNANIVESYPGISSPLTETFIKDIAYYKVFKGLGRRLVQGRADLLAAYEDCFANMVVALNSRIYYRLDNFYRLLTLLPGSSWLIPVWQDMLGIRQRQVPTEPMKISLWQRLKVAGQLLKALWNNRRAMRQLDQDFQRVEAYFNVHYHPQLSISELQALFRQLEEQVIDQWDLTLVNDLYAFIFTGLLQGKSTQAEQIAGIYQLESMKPTYALNQLVADLQEQAALPQLTSLIQSLEAGKSLSDLPDTALLARIRAYLEAYGDRVPEELKLETHTFRTHPQKFLSLLRSRLTDQVEASSVQPDEIDRQEPIWHPLQRFLIQRAKLGIQYRERSRLNRTRLYGMTRSIFRSMGQRLVEQGRLEEVDDIFMLRVDEIMDRDFDTSTKDLSNVIAQRRAKMQADSQLPVYSRLIFADEIFEKNPHEYLPFGIQQGRQDLLYGIASSPGRVKGPVIRIDQVQEIDLHAVKGKIIVCKMTDPGWVFLLMLAKGIVAERGSLLSHTAIISRELKIPAVVNVKGIMDQVEHQDWIDLDGDRGQVQIIRGGEGNGD